MCVSLCRAVVCVEEDEEEDEEEGEDNVGVFGFVCCIFVSVVDCGNVSINVAIAKNKPRRSSNCWCAPNGEKCVGVNERFSIIFPPTPSH